MGKKAVKKEQEDGLKFLRAELENFKNIDKKIVEIGGRSLLIMGKNGAGKSSIIQALTSPLDVKVRPSKPVKSGETHSSVSVTIGGSINGEPKEYILDLYFSPKYESGRLKVTDINGENVENAPGFIKSLIGRVSFDVMNWITDTKAKRLEKIKDLTGIAKELDLLNMEIDENKKLKGKRKERAEELESVLKNHSYTQEEIDLYSKPMDLSVLQEEMKAISANQEKWDGVKNKVSGFEREALQLTDAAEKGRLEIKRLEGLIEAEKARVHDAVFNKESLVKKIEQGKDWLAKVPRPSSDVIADKMIAANAHNDKCSQVSSLAEKNKEMIKAKDDVFTIEATIKKMENTRTDKIKKSQLPIHGLTFDNDNVYLNDIPVEEGGINTAELMKVSIDMAIHSAKKSNLKVIFINDASLFDANTLKHTVDKIEEAGMQAIVELVDFNGGDLEIKFTEETLS